MAAPAFSHSPVLLRQVLQHLAPPAALAAAGASAVTAPGGRTARRLAPALDASKYTFMDATFGGGGYTRAILEKFPNSKVIAIDQDPAAMEQAKQLAEQFKGRFIPLRGKFGSMTKLLESELGMIGPCLDGVVFDIGVSSYQLDNAYRGFSFRNEGPLDMRMCADTLVGPQFDELANSSLTADHIVNTFAESELADIIFEYGDERKSRRIARAIVQARDVNPIKTTRELSELVVKSAGKNYGAIHPATRTFQALRIYVNDELGELKRGLAAAELHLKATGRLITVTFHSLEDRIVKNFLRSCSGRVSGPGLRYYKESGRDGYIGIERYRNRHMGRELKNVMAMEQALEKDIERLQAFKEGAFTGAVEEEDNEARASFKLSVRKAVAPTDEEVKENPRARSAKLRVAERTENPPLHNICDA